MKLFDHLVLSHAAAMVELSEFKALLDSRPELSERDDILPFFRQHRHLSLAVGLLSSNLSSLDRLAYEYDLFGDFSCDLVIGDSNRPAYTLVEFEDARAQSVFQAGSKYTHEWGRRFEHGFSQLVDWFWKLEDQAKTNDFRNRLGDTNARFSAMLVIGRNQFLPERERQRLNWRLDRVIINSNKATCLTLDDLYEQLYEKLTRLQKLASGIE
jgi:hypothetical protein